MPAQKYDHQQVVLAGQNGTVYTLINYEVRKWRRLMNLSVAVFFHWYLNEITQQLRYILSSLLASA